MDQCATADSENDTNIKQGQDVAGQAASDIVFIEDNTPVVQQGLRDMETAQMANGVQNETGNN